jgi:putative oxidoreductase
MLKTARAIDGILSRIPEASVLLFARIVVAHIFWASGRSKVEGWFTFRPEVIDLFRDEYRLPLIPPEWAAPLVTVAEHVLPILLVAGLLTRFASLALIIMTLVIQIFVYSDAWWTQHSLWLAPLLFLLTRGGGAWSIDRLLQKSV